MLVAACATEPSPPRRPRRRRRRPPRWSSRPSRHRHPLPELTPAQAKAQAQKLAIEAVDQLQNGDETGARQTLEQGAGARSGQRSREEAAWTRSRPMRRRSWADVLPLHGAARRLAVEARAAVPRRPLPLLHPRQVQRHRESEPARRRAGDQDSRRRPAAAAARRRRGPPPDAASRPTPAASAAAAERRRPRRSRR